MSTTELASTLIDGEPSFSQANLLDSDRLQDLDSGGPPTSTDYQNQMDAMFGEIKATCSDGTDLWTARTEVWNRYVTGTDSPINAFSQVMLRAGYDDHYSGVIVQCDEMKRNLSQWST
jgi:hypothetical protein